MHMHPTNVSFVKEIILPAWIGLSEAAFDVFLGLGIGGREEHGFARADFNHLALQEESREIGDPGSLLGVVRGDHHRQRFTQFVQQGLDLGGGYGVERRGGLIQQDHLGFKRQHPGDAQALLLPARKRRGGGVQPVVNFIPQNGLL